MQRVVGDCGREGFLWSEGDPWSVVKWDGVSVPQVVSNQVLILVDPPVPSYPLSDEFLRYVARRYVELGRGYARVLAREYVVSPRTASSWVEKARRRGVL